PPRGEFTEKKLRLFSLCSAAFVSSVVDPLLIFY
ncbi:MAG: hypothetical protein ACI88A_004835, partial [Paraglaciecola sp.]